MSKLYRRRRISKYHWLRCWATSPTVSNQMQPMSITAPIRPSPMVKKFHTALPCHRLIIHTHLPIITYLAEQKSNVQRGDRFVEVDKTFPSHQNPLTFDVCSEDWTLERSILCSMFDVLKTFFLCIVSVLRRYVVEQGQSSQIVCI